MIAAQGFTFAAAEASMIVARAKIKPFLLCMMSGFDAIQLRAAAAVLLGGLLVFLSAVLGIVVVLLAITNTASGAIALASLGVLLIVLAQPRAFLLTIAVCPSVMQFSLLRLAGLPPFAAALKTPRVVPILVSDVYRVAFKWLSLIAFLTRFHCRPFTVSVNKVVSL